MKKQIQLTPLTTAEQGQLKGGFSIISPSTFTTDLIDGNNGKCTVTVSNYGACGSKLNTVAKSCGS